MFELSNLKKIAELGTLAPRAMVSRLGFARLERPNTRNSNTSCDRF